MVLPAASSGSRPGKTRQWNCHGIVTEALAKDPRDSFLRMYAGAAGGVQEKWRWPTGFSVTEVTRPEAWTLLCTLQVLLQPFNGAGEFIALMFAFDKTVALLRVVHRIHSSAFRLQYADHLLGFFLRHADVVVTLENEKRSFLISDVLQRRTCFIHSTVLHRVTEQTLFILLQARVFVLQHA